MMDIEAEMYELALMRYTVTVICQLEGDKITYFIDLFSPPDDAGLEERITSAKGVSLHVAIDQVKENLLNL